MIEKKKIICDICNRLISDGSLLHFYHKSDCPNFVNFVEHPEAGQPSYPECECNFTAHLDCCPQCNPLADERVTMQ